MARTATRTRSGSSARPRKTAASPTPRRAGGRDLQSVVQGALRTLPVEQFEKRLRELEKMVNRLDKEVRSTISRLVKAISSQTPRGIGRGRRATRTAGTTAKRATAKAPKRAARRRATAKTATRRAVKATTRKATSARKPATRRKTATKRTASSPRKATTRATARSAATPTMTPPSAPPTAPVSEGASSS
jgi:DNA-binding protein HU-beta